MNSFTKRAALSLHKCTCILYSVLPQFTQDELGLLLWTSTFNIITAHVSVWKFLITEQFEIFECRTLSREEFTNPSRELAKCSQVKNLAAVRVLAGFYYNVEGPGHGNTSSKADFQHLSNRDRFLQDVTAEAITYVAACNPGNVL